LVILYQYLTNKTFQSISKKFITMKLKGRTSPLTANKKMAPRSSNQFRIGPPFGPTEVVRSIVDENTAPITPLISARIDRGFDMIDGGWVGYKRNYFTLVACFRFVDQPLDICLKSRFFYKESGSLVKIKAFKLSLRHTCLDQENFRTTLVQHTAKRDRGPQFEPPEYLIIPGELPAHEIMRELANIRNGPKISFYDSLFYLLGEERQVSIDNNTGILSTYPKESRIAMIARYERIQFQTFPIGSKRFGATGQDLTFLVVQLMGVKENGTEVLLATTTTAPLTVRGRSPLNYTGISIGKVARATEDPCHQDENIDTKLKRRSKYRHENDNSGDYDKHNQEKRRKVLSDKTGKILQRNRALENHAASLFESSLIKSGHQTVTVSSISAPQRTIHPESYSSLVSPTQRFVKAVRRTKANKCFPLPFVGCEISSDLDSYSGSPSRRDVESYSGDSGADNYDSLQSKSSYVIRLPIGQMNCAKIALVEDSQDNSLHNLDPVHDVIEILSDDETLNGPCNARESHSESVDDAVDPFFELHDLAINCPLGCFPSFPASNNDFFLQTSTPFLRKSLDIAHGEVQKYALCKHGFKRTVKRTVSSRSYGSEDLVSDNYDSSFVRFRSCLDNIKKAIRLPEIALSSLTSLDSSHSQCNVLWEDLLVREAVKVAHLV